MGGSKDAERLARLRGGRDPRSVTSGVVAGQSANTQCGLLTVANAAGVTLDRVLENTKYKVPFGQASSAITRGRAFERMVKDDDYKELLRVLRDDMNFQVTDARVANLRKELPHNPKDPYRQLRARAERTRNLIKQTLDGHRDAPNLVDGAVLTVELGGQTGYLETDALALRFEGPIRVGEIKSFPIVDGRADAEKVGAAMDQTAVYVMALQDTVSGIGGSASESVSTEVLLIAARNTGMKPVLYKHDVARRVAHHRRQLAEVLDLEDLLGEMPADLVFPGPKDTEADVALAGIALHTGTAYEPHCLSFCGLSRWCRSRAHADGDPARLGTGVVRYLPSIERLDRAVALADGATPSKEEAPVAELLVQGAQLIDIATGTSGRSRRSR